MYILFRVSTTEDPMKTKEGMTMTEGKGKTEITLEEAEQVTGGAAPKWDIFVCPKCSTHFRSAAELEAHCKTAHNFNAWDKSSGSKG